jgi:hypothetical protein
MKMLRFFVSRSKVAFSRVAELCLMRVVFLGV